MTDNFTGDFFGLIGKPMLWNTNVYGTVAVHIKSISPNGRVAVLTIDGGEASTPAQRFPELSDGIGFAILGDLSKRAPAVRKPRTRKAAPGMLPVLPTAEAVRNVPAKVAAGMVKPARTRKAQPSTEVRF